MYAKIRFALEFFYTGDELDVPTLATVGLSCMQRVWNDPNQCQSVCPQFTIFDYVRMHHCSLCLHPCIGKN